MTESAAVLLKDGVVVAAAEQERFTRVKHDGGIPYQAVEYVLSSQGLRLDDLDAVAVYWDPYQLGFRMRYMLGQMARPEIFFQKLRRAFSIAGGMHTSGADAGWMSIFQIQAKLSRRFHTECPKVHFLDHHLAHMASCFYGSRFEEAAILIMDGAGEAASTTSGAGRGTKLEILDQHLLPHSLGHFYSSITGYLGFKMLDGEYKLMGLSPYGDPSAASWMREHFLISTGPGRYFLDTTALDYHRAFQGDFRGTFQDYFGPPRPAREDEPFTAHHEVIAASAQRAFEEVVYDLARDLQKKTGLKKLAIAGGCGLNCVANGKILKEGIFEEIYVPPVPHDAGGALGAAQLLHVNLTGQRPGEIRHAQFGPEFSNADIEQALSASSGLIAKKMETDALIARAAETIANGEVIAWMQGRMEYGPRALGNRSYVADPRSDSIRDTINAKIKKRELFRPFAPSVKAEKAGEYFEIDQDSPFMTIIVPVRPEAREKIPAVTHVDGSARPQTVEKSVNPRYWQLLDEFEKRTGVAALLNTSFNIQEPIVCTPAQALHTFGNSTTDALVMGDYWIVHAGK